MSTSPSRQSPDEQEHREAMQSLQAEMDAKIAAAKEKRGLIIVHTGDGKGKSSSAFGMLARMIAHKRRCAVVQFIKSGADAVERPLRGPLLEWHATGGGFTWNTQDRAGDIARCREGWKLACGFFANPEIDFVLLDELNIVLAYDYLPKDEILAELKKKRIDQHIVITGRNALPELIELADLVTEMKEIKHPFKTGVKAQPGIEFEMKALSVLGTSSNAGKTWLTTALCAWLRREGVRVAPFKAQNMSNNAWATPGGGEMARAQAVQAEACGLAPCVEMNPILLKPSSQSVAQLIVLGEARAHLEGRDYYTHHEALWQTVATTLDGWKSRCEVLVLEGAGSPVELNLMERDLVNLRPIRHLDGRWLLVGDIDRGGIFAQLAGTWALLPEADRARSLGAVVNRFRGDISLFPDPNRWLAPHAPGFEVLGTVPFRRDLQPEEEDGLAHGDEDRGEGETIAWVRCPHAANLSDCQPWWDDTGVRTRWTDSPAVLAQARVIVLPGSKNTLADLRWLRARGLAHAIRTAAEQGALIIGICGGYQMLGTLLSDPTGVAGDAGVEPGLGLLPVETEFLPKKIVRQVTAECDGQRWSAYEIHMGRTKVQGAVENLQTVWDGDQPRTEGMRHGRVWGTYLHGWFESPRLRAQVAAAGGITGHRPHPVTWAEKRQAVYTAMADHVVAHVNLDGVRRYLGI